MRGSFLIAGAVAVALATGCDDPIIQRKITLAAHSVLPAGSSTVVGSRITLVATNLEPVLAAARYVVWAETANSVVALAAYLPGQQLWLDPEAAGVALNAITGLRITEEVADSTLPSTPGRQRLRGVLGGALVFVPLPPAQAAAAGGEAVMLNDKLTLRTGGLAALTDGLSYGVWARFSHSSSCGTSGSTATVSVSDAGHVHPAALLLDDGGPAAPDAAVMVDAGGMAMEDGGSAMPDAAMVADAGGMVMDDGGSARPDGSSRADAGGMTMPDAGHTGMDGGMGGDGGGMAGVPGNEGYVFLGSLDSSGTLVQTYPYLLATMQEILVSIESARGYPDGISPVRVLHGAFTLPTTTAASTESAPHTH